MPNNTINISFDLLKLQGAKKITGKDGKDYVAICIPESRIKVFNGKNGESMYLGLDVKANKGGEDERGKTHFVAEATTKEERLAKTLLPIIGNGKEFVFGNSGGQRQQSPPARQQNAQPSEDDSEIPFN
jgi:hypothetical protein